MPRNQPPCLYLNSVLRSRCHFVLSSSMDRTSYVRLLGQTIDQSVKKSNTKKISVYVCYMWKYNIAPFRNFSLKKQIYANILSIRVFSFCITETGVYEQSILFLHWYYSAKRHLLSYHLQRHFPASEREIPELNLGWEEIRVRYGLPWRLLLVFDTTSTKTFLCNTKYTFCEKKIFAVRLINLL